MRMLTSITDEDIVGLSGYQRIISAGICVDKFRLIRNESTENISIDTINENIEDSRERIIEAEQRLFELTGIDHEAERKALRAKVLKRLGKPLEGETQTENNKQCKEDLSQ